MSSFRLSIKKHLYAIISCNRNRILGALALTQVLYIYIYIYIYINIMILVEYCCALTSDVSHGIVPVAISSKDKSKIGIILVALVLDSRLYLMIIIIVITGGA